MKLRTVLVGVAGATAMYFLDPDTGRGRRSRCQDRLGAAVRRRRRTKEQRERDESNRAAGRRAVSRGAGTFRPTDEVAIAQHANQILADLDFATDDVTIEVAGDTVRVRGQVPGRRELDDVVSALDRAPGVERVENLLHLPGEPAPNKERARQADAGASVGRGSDSGDGAAGQP